MEKIKQKIFRNQNCDGRILMQYQCDGIRRAGTKPGGQPCLYTGKTDLVIVTGDLPQKTVVRGRALKMEWRNESRDLDIEKMLKESRKVREELRKMEMESEKWGQRVAKLKIQQEKKNKKQEVNDMKRKETEGNQKEKGLRRKDKMKFTQENRQVEVCKKEDKTKNKQRLVKKTRNIFKTDHIRAAVNGLRNAVAPDDLIGMRNLNQADAFYNFKAAKLISHDMCLHI